MKRVFLTVTLLLLAGVAGVAWREVGRERNAATAAGAVAAENARTRAAIRAAEQRLAAAERDRGARAAGLAASVMTEAAAKDPAPTTEAVDVAAAFKRAREREKDPKVQAIRLASGRAQLVTSHGAFFRKQAMTPAQIEQFQDIAARRSELHVDLKGILDLEAQKNGSVSAETKAAVAKLEEEAKREMETARRALLGEEGFQALREYSRTVRARDCVSNLVGAATVAGLPFTAEQAEQLTQVLANASSAYREGGEATGMNIDWSRADEQARGILSAPQLEFFQTVDPPQSWEGRFQRRHREAVAEAAKADAERKRDEAGKPSGG